MCHGIKALKYQYITKDDRNTVQSSVNAKSFVLQLWIMSQLITVTSLITKRKANKLIDIQPVDDS